MPRVPAWPLRLALWVDGAALERAGLPAWARALAAEAAAGPRLAAALGDPGLSPSRVDALLGRARPGALVAAVAAGAPHAALWAAHWRDLRPAVDGSDLVAAGVRPGPAIGRALAAVRAAVLDGRVGGRDEQLALALAVAGAR
jgi:tRNA nucleotidyltransferase (CCA-adding enzyme)